MVQKILISLIFFFFGLSPESDSTDRENELVPLDINRTQLVEIAVTGYVREPFVTPATYRISPEGTARARGNYFIHISVREY
jgi:hypothetical protein